MTETNSNEFHSFHSRTLKRLTAWYVDDYNKNYCVVSIPIDDIFMRRIESTKKD